MSAGLGRPGIAIAVALGLLPVQARADTVSETVDEVRRLRESIALVVEIGYALRDPAQLLYLPSQIYGAFLDVLERDPVTAAILDNLAGQYKNGFVRVALDAGTTVEGSTSTATTAALTASAAAAWELPICRVIGASAYGLAGYDGDALGAYALSGTACLPLPANTLQVSYTRRDNVRTTLLARPVVLRDRRRNDIVDVMIRFYRYLGAHNQIDVMPFDLHVDVARSAETRGFGAQDAELEIAPIEWHRRGKGFLGADQIFQFMQFHAWFFGDDEGTREAANSVISPLTVEGITLGSDAAFGADVGVAQAYGRQGMTDLVRKTDVHARGWLDVAIRPVIARLELGHTILPTYGGQLVVDDRASLRAQTVIAHYTARLETFIARSRVLRDSEPDGTAVVIAGGAMDASWAPIPNVHLVGRIEAARVIDAIVAIDPVTTRLDVRATIGLTTHYDRRW